MTGRRFLVTFGRKRSRDADAAYLAAWRSGRKQPGIRLFEPGTTPPFRFGSDDGVRYAPARLAELSDTTSKLAQLNDALARDLDVFARYPRRLLDIYFEFIAARLAAERDALESLLRPLGGLFRVEDWAFAALRPLPNAAVFDADDDAMPPVVLHHDMAFWTGQTVLMVRLQGGATPSLRERDAGARLECMGVQIVVIPVQELATGTAIFSEARFPDAFLSFWQGQPYPASPFRPEGLPADLLL